jgi:hypothetical protein
VTASSNKDLGKLVSEHKSTTRGFLKVVGFSLIGLAIASGFLYGAILSGDSNIGGRIIMGIFGLMFLSVPALGVYGLVRGRDNAIRVYENGIAIRKLGTDTTLVWDDIASYDDGSFLIIETKDGASLEFGMSSLGGLSGILSKLRDEVITKRTVPRMKATLLEGKAGEFESDSEMKSTPENGVTDVLGFTVDVEGITPFDSNDLVPWKQVTSCEVEEKTIASGKFTLVIAYVVISTNSGKFRAIMNNRSNREAMLGLCKEMMSA